MLHVQSQTPLGRSIGCARGRFEPAREMLLRAAIGAAESGRVPDPLVRLAIRRLAADRLRDEARKADADGLRDLLSDLRRSPIAVHTDSANQQHYELPPAFFRAVLGPRLKYSGAYWPAGVSHLRGAEEAMLALTCRRAQLTDGMRVLDLGCGWGSLTGWIAEHYPRCQIVSVSNSRPRRTTSAPSWWPEGSIG